MIEDKEKRANAETNEMANILAWAGLTEGMIAADTVREIEENEDRHRLDSRPGLIRPPYISWKKLYGIFSVSLIVLSVAFFFWLLSIFIQKLTLGPP